MIAQAMAGLANPPQTVSTIAASTQQWTSDIEAVGSLRAVNGANLSSQVPGIVSALHFESGADVKKGDLLVELMANDDRETAAEGKGCAQQRVMSLRPGRQVDLPTPARIRPPSFRVSKLDALVIYGEVIQQRFSFSDMM
jgi:hypothetical protein